jgi:hypothetical protein
MTNIVGKFDLIGTEKEDQYLCLKDYISYDEMQISSLLSVACPSFFINNGSRYNKARKQKDDEYERQGVYVGMVGARFEVLEQMESQHILISRYLNTEENGYGRNRDESSQTSKKMKIWEKFYRVHPFPTFDEAIQLSKNEENQIVPSGNDYFFNMKVYKERMRMVIEPYFLFCNQYSESASKRGHVRVVGLGLGVWFDVHRMLFFKFKFIIFFFFISFQITKGCSITDKENCSLIVAIK